MGKRSFDAMSVVATGTQNFSDRFGKKRRYGEEDDSLPALPWRCNLTGLSQVHNLYFVAYGRAIHVYIPRFPDQAITAASALVIATPPSGPHLTGYLDPRRPHAINNLIVEHLGHEEVVAVVRDDGDIDVYLVRHIVQAIERRARVDSTIGVSADEVKPVFQNNVGISAWGLAIHSNARILAVSSNMHEVRVFKFGLLRDGEGPEDDGFGQDVSGSEDDDADHLRGLRRETDVTHQVFNGEANIPNIAFCNTGDDPDGRWLLTTDISGVCRIMDMHLQQPVQAFRCGASFLGAGSGGFDRVNAGWTIMFLNRRSFRREQTLKAALGIEQDEDFARRRDGDIWDLSRTIANLENISNRFGSPTTTNLPAHQPNVLMPQNEEYNETAMVSTLSRDGSETGGGGSVASSSAEIDIEQQTGEDEDTGEESEYAIEATDSENGLENDDQGVGIDIEPHDLDEAEGGSAMFNGSSTDDEEELNPDINATAFVDGDEDPDYEGTEDDVAFTSYYNGSTVCGNQVRFVRPTSLCNDLPCPILHASIRNAYLLQPSNQRFVHGPSCPPMVGIANPLRQDIRRGYEGLRIFERLNMSTYIPQLGVVVLASQKGRALVLSLTKLYRKAATALPSGTATPKADRQTLAKNAMTVYTMRVECILPFADQEKAGQRPFVPLHGIAAGPVQGSEGCHLGQKRWRLMMMYQDHSILSYEITRSGANWQSGAQVQRLVV